MSQELIQVPFHGDIIEAVRTAEGKVLVPLRQPCKSLGLDYSGQLQKLKNKEWATVEIISTVGADQKTREMVCLDLDSFPMWLATIEASRVGDDIRERVVLYQKEATKVLAAHFFGTAREPAAATAATAWVQATEMISSLAGLVDQLVSRVERIEHVSHLPVPVFHPHGQMVNQLAMLRPPQQAESGVWIVIRERIQERAPYLTELYRKRIVDAMRRKCNRQRIWLTSVTSGKNDRSTGPLVIDQIHLSMVDKEIDRVCRDYEREVEANRQRELAKGPTLFDELAKAN